MTKNYVQACLPVVGNNRKVVGALSVVGEVPKKIKRLLEEVLVVEISTQKNKMK